MKKRVFRSKLLYVISVVFFTLITFLMFTALVGQLGNGFNLYASICLLTLSVLSLITCIKLFEKEQNVIIFINTMMSLFLILIIRNSFSFYSTHYTYEPKNLIYCCLIITYLVLVNRNKVNNKNIEEIEDIGKSE